MDTSKEFSPVVLLLFVFATAVPAAPIGNKGGLIDAQFSANVAHESFVNEDNNATSAIDGALNAQVSTIKGCTLEQLFQRIGEVLSKMVANAGGSIIPSIHDDSGHNRVEFNISVTAEQDNNVSTRSRNFRKERSSGSEQPDPFHIGGNYLKTPDDGGFMGANSGGESLRTDRRHRQNIERPSSWKLRRIADQPYLESQEGLIRNRKAPDESTSIGEKHSESSIDEGKYPKHSSVTGLESNTQLSDLRRQNVDIDVDTFDSQHYENPTVSEQIPASDDNTETYVESDEDTSAEDSSGITESQQIPLINSGRHHHKHYIDIKHPVHKIIGDSSISKKYPTEQLKNTPEIDLKTFSDTNDEEIDSEEEPFHVPVNSNRSSNFDLHRQKKHLSDSDCNNSNIPDPDRSSDNPVNIFTQGAGSGKDRHNSEYDSLTPTRPDVVSSNQLSLQHPMKTTVSSTARLGPFNFSLDDIIRASTNVRPFNNGSLFPLFIPDEEQPNLPDRTGDSRSPRHLYHYLRDAADTPEMQRHPQYSS